MSSPRTATRERILDAALEVFARKGYHRAIVDDIAARLARSVAAAIAEQHGALAKVEGALTATLATFAASERLARVILLEGVSLGPTYQAKRAEVAGRFAALIRGYLDEAVAGGSIALLDTGVTTLAWLGAVNERSPPSPA